MTFHHPSIWALTLLALLPLLWLRWRNPKRRPALSFSTLAFAEAVPATWAVRVRWIIPALRSIAIALLIFALARPEKGNEQTRINTEGIAIQIIVDRSGSMRAQDFTIDGKPTDRLTVVKKVVQEFVLGGNGSAGRPDDMIGAIVFGTFADSICPLTTDHAHLVDTINKTSIAADQSEGATAIGDAIALGVERLRTIEQRIGVRADQTVKSKIMILLTDGESNAGDMEPLKAAEMAAAFNIKVYTIGAGTNEGFAPVPVQSPFGGTIMQRMAVSIDEDTLRKIAAASGGQYFRATDTDSLRQIYEQIDKLERTKVEERRYMTYRQAAVEPITIGPLRVPPLLAVVLGVLCLETLLIATRFRTIP